jgi:hypothetical protein
LVETAKEEGEAKNEEELREGEESKLAKGVMRWQVEKWWLISQGRLLYWARLRLHAV